MHFILKLRLIHSNAISNYVSLINIGLFGCSTKHFNKKNINFLTKYHSNYRCGNTQLYTISKLLITTHLDTFVQIILIYKMFVLITVDCENF